ncbi:MAG: hypothetical protein FJ293_10075 [Planctomycetes bacterium]|nr:hypothetical protein [Planctomycetota bacterium]
MPKEGPKESKTIIPMWMCSYSDMMTNLLCFFILVVSMASTQAAGFTYSGIGSYLDTLEALGLPGVMPSHRTLIPKSSPLARYKPPKIDPLDQDDWVEHTDKMLNEELDLIRSGSGEVVAPGTRVALPLGCTFSPGSARLTLKDRENLAKLAPSLALRPGRIEVLGACSAEEGAAKERLALGLERARAVVRYLVEQKVPAARLVPLGTAATGDAAEGGGKGAARNVTLRWYLAE